MVSASGSSLTEVARMEACVRKAFNRTATNTRNKIIFIRFPQEFCLLFHRREHTRRRVLKRCRS